MLHVLARSAGLLGGLAWVARLILDRTGSLGASASDALLWGGAALLAVAVLDVGLGLVPRAPVWLRVVVALGSVALAGSVVAVLHGDGDGVVVDGVVGALAVVVFALRLVRGVRSRSEGSAAEQRTAARCAAPRRSAGSHAR
ncbi:hypothetical protein [Nocardioides perillae]|uniref:Uncharacterized protein n=1 Tax=Nocardioides perillae TaxID=1119534 RepID=A0A7Y9RUE5_9ACTN|nr:hypothetical protein [Nocardioides perillae]NYG54788.1 hypothetical protein [Nocardioides perillae]